MIKYVVYQTTNLVNGKIYVGQHKTIKGSKDYYIGSGSLIRQAIKKYGHENFKCEILHEFDTREEAAEMEALIVNEDFIARPDVYNLMVGGNGPGGKGRKLSQEHIDAIRASKLGVPRSEEMKRKMSATRKLRKIPSPNKGKSLSNEHKAALRKAKLGKPGPPMPESTRIALRKSNSVPRSEEFKSKFKKKLLIDGVLYNSCSEVANKFGISNGLVTHRLKSDKWPGWNYHD